ncbi:MAG: hypothetical protein OXU23_07830 [Candidatus Poribacteria bacterium]|nr:hypothetical protein [Candidatus Poribacteria bacterium]
MAIGSRLSVFGSLVFIGGRCAFSQGGAVTPTEDDKVYKALTQAHKS